MFGSRSLSSSVRSKITATGTRENGLAYSREKLEKIVINNHCPLCVRVLSFRLQPFFAIEQLVGDRKRSSDKSFTFEGHRVTNFESTVSKLKSLKTLLAIIINWKVNGAIKDRKENPARRTATTMIILANNYALLLINQAQ